MSRIFVRELRVDELARAAAITARAMRDNPINILVFGGPAERRTRRLVRIFTLALSRIQRDGVLLGAFQTGELVGAAGMLRPGRCQLSRLESLTTVSKLLGSIDVRTIYRIGIWQNEWKKRDLQEAHWHLGPIAVDVEVQGRGIGSAMITGALGRIDELGACAHLETDRFANVAFYKKFDFHITAEANVYAVPNWFMRRPAGKLRL